MRVDVLVIGLGPAGASAALQAAAAGCEVLAVDRKKLLGEPVQCAEFVPMPMLRHCQDEGVLRQRVQGMKTYLPSQAHEASAFPGLMVDRARFDQAIARQAQRAGARLRLSTRLTALDLERQQATMVTDGVTEVVAYQMLVAADGPRSSVARLAHLPALATVQTRQYTVPLHASYEDTDIWLSDDFPGGYAWLFPKGNEANLGIGADRHYETDLKTPLERLHAALVAQGVVGADVISRTGGEIPVGGLRTRLVHGRIVFVGDAAGLTHPITGAGISAAVISGERAGTAAAAFLQAHDPAELASFEEDIRDQFEDTLTRAVARRQWLADHWRTPAAREDEVMRRGWIAFPEYFQDRAPGLASTPVS